MKTIFTTLFLYIILLSSGQAQWIPQGQGLLPSRYGISDIAVVDENTVWVLATTNVVSTVLDTAIILRSTDGGDTWQKIILEQFPDRYVLFIDAIDADTAWLSMGAPNADQYIYRTEDGGASWQEQLMLPAVFNVPWAPAIKFLHNEKGYFIDLIKSVSGSSPNGGLSWGITSTPTLESNEYWGVNTSQNWFDVKGDTIWWGTSKRIFRSTDQGATWNDFFPGFLGNNQITSLSFNPQGLGLAISDSNLDLPYIPSFLSETIVAKSTDFGETWNVLGNNVPFPLTVITEVPGMSNTFMAASGFWEWYDPIIKLSWASAYTTDGGENWVVIDRDIPYHAIGFASASTGWVGRIGNHDYGQDNPAVFKWNGTITAAESPYKKENHSYRVTPNPFCDHIFIEDPVPGGSIQSVDIMNARGIVLETLSVNDLSAQDFSVLPCGIYFLKITGVNGPVLEKIVKL